MASVSSSGDNFVLHFGQGNSLFPSILAKSILYSRSNFVFIFRFLFFSVVFTSNFYEYRVILQVFRAKESSQKGSFVLVWQPRFMLLHRLVQCSFCFDIYVSTIEYKGVCDLFIIYPNF